jgi:hypothetical protein
MIFFLNTTIFCRLAPNFNFGTPFAIGWAKQENNLNKG